MKTRGSDNRSPPFVEGSSFDLDVALRAIHRLAVEDGDLGAEYWRQVAALLQSAAAMRARIQDLERGLNCFSGAGHTGVAQGGVLPLVAEYIVASTDLTPTVVHERYRIECNVPLFGGDHPIEFGVMNDQRGEILRAQVAPSMVSESVGLMMQGLVAARFGSAALSAPTSFGTDFNRVAFSVEIRHALAPNVPLEAICITATERGWTVHYRTRSLQEEETWEAVQSDADPLHLLWRIAGKLGIGPMTS